MLMCTYINSKTFKFGIVITLENFMSTLHIIKCPFGVQLLLFDSRTLLFTFILVKCMFIRLGMQNNAKKHFFKQFTNVRCSNV